MLEGTRTAVNTPLSRLYIISFSDWSKHGLGVAGSMTSVRGARASELAGLGGTENDWFPYLPSVPRNLLTLLPARRRFHDGISVPSGWVAGCQGGMDGWMALRGPERLVQGLGARSWCREQGSGAGGVNGLGTGA